MSHQFRRHPEEMNNQKIQKSEHENEKIHSKYPMSNNENNTKNASNLTQHGVDNNNDSTNICNEYVYLKCYIFYSIRLVFYCMHFEIHIILKVLLLLRGTLNRNSKDEIVTDTKLLEILKDLKADIQTIARRSDTHSQTNGKWK